MSSTNLDVAATRVLIIIVPLFIWVWLFKAMFVLPVDQQTFVSTVGKKLKDVLFLPFSLAPSRFHRMGTIVFVSVRQSICPHFTVL